MSEADRHEEITWECRRDMQRQKALDRCKRTEVDEETGEEKEVISGEMAAPIIARMLD